ncbi:MAG: SH3 domain-containing protein [Candidatus Omnitrophica bacterium]|nr:SH3 domain-containing protein [Candidatus Omnitrophota bacterium]
MLNKISTICSSVFLIFAFIAPGFADEHFPFLAEVSKESVNVRSGPNTNFEKIDKLTKGVQVVVLGRSYEWYKIQLLSTTKSYIRSDYLKIKEGGDVAVVLGDNVNVRSSASSDAASLGEVKKGTLVKVEGQVNGWCRLEPVAGTAGWVHKDFLKEISADVPSSYFIPTIQWPSTVEVKYISKVVIERVSVQGKLQALPESVGADVHYEIVIDDKTVYYVQDIPQISFFANMVVTIEGTVMPDLQKQFTCPLLHINKITLVL